MLRLAAATTLASGLALSFAAPGFAQDVIDSQQESFTVTTVAQGLGFPWSLAFLPTGEMLVTERDGALRVIDQEGLRAAPVSGLPEDLVVERQGGMMEIAVAPDFDQTREVYFTYSEGTADANRTVLARARLSEDLSALENVEDLFKVNFEKRRGFHFGGRILFNPDDTLFVTLGDGGMHQDEAQNPANHLGTVVRINRDGSIPADNPTIEGAAPGVYSYGHRNVQGIDRNPETGSVFTHEHGARGGDELNVLQPGANYGWPAVTYGINYNGSVVSLQQENPAFTEPVWYWNPSIAPAGMAFHDGTQFPNWEGDLFVSALAGMALQRLEMDGDRVIGVEPLLTEREERYRDVRVGPDGAIYVLVDDIEGAVLKLEHAPTAREEAFEG
ncbi:MAG: PQQ-dependent sugar dehydrogenase [Oceanicaulis sp.]